MQFTVVVNKSNRELRWQGASYSGRTLFLFLWKLLLFHHLLQDVCHIILVDAGSFIVLHVCVLSALRHSYRGLSCFFVIRSRTFFDGSKGFVLFSKEYNIKKPNLSPIGKKFGFCSEKHPLHVLKPCKIRAETVHLLSDKQNRSILHRLDGIGLRGHTPKIKSWRGILPHAVISAMR